jgi:hypothetical protein
MKVKKDRRCFASCHGAIVRTDYALSSVLETGLRDVIFAPKRSNGRSFSLQLN